MEYTIYISHPVSETPEVQIIEASSDAEAEQKGHKCIEAITGFFLEKIYKKTKEGLQLVYPK